MVKFRGAAGAFGERRAAGRAGNTAVKGRWLEQKDTASSAQHSEFALDYSVDIWLVQPVDIFWLQKARQIFLSHF